MQRNNISKKHTCLARASASAYAFPGLPFSVEPKLSAIFDKPMMKERHYSGGTSARNANPARGR